MFIIQYFTNPKQTGALCASSSKLASAMTENIEFQKARNIAEIGAGTGAFTRHILSKKDEDANFFAVEINKKMANKLSHKFENLDIEINSALNLRKILSKRKINKLDIVISSIPWALLKEKEQEQLLYSIYECLDEGGYFTTFAYILPTRARARFRKKLFTLFGEVKTSKTVWQNIPPAFVYYCKK